MFLIICFCTYLFHIVYTFWKNKCNIFHTFYSKHGECKYTLFPRELEWLASICLINCIEKCFLFSIGISGFNPFFIIIPLILFSFSPYTISTSFNLKMNVRSELRSLIIKEVCTSQSINKLNHKDLCLYLTSKLLIVVMSCNNFKCPSRIISDQLEI